MHNTISILDQQVLSDKKYCLSEVTFTVNDGDLQKKEVYARPDCAVILLYNTKKQTVILIRQLRIPTYLNGNETGILTECCAGVIDNGETPEQCIRRECVEETGYQPEDIEQICEAYTSPASVKEKMTLFIGPYDESIKVSEGGGLKEEQEEIEVLEIRFDKAFAMIAAGEIKDAKTIILLLHLKMKGIMER